TSAHTLGYCALRHNVRRATLIAQTVRNQVSEYPNQRLYTKDRHERSGNSRWATPAELRSVAAPSRPGQVPVQLQLPESQSPARLSKQETVWRVHRYKPLNDTE